MAAVELVGNTRSAVIAGIDYVNKLIDIAVEANRAEAILAGRNGEQALQRQGVLELQGGRLDEAGQAFEQLLRIDPDNPDALANLGTVRQQQGRYEQACAAMNSALAIAPQRADIHYNLGNTLAASGRWHEAEDAYRQAITLSPDNALFHYNLGAALHHQGLLEAAAESYRRATVIDGHYVEALTNHGIVLRELGRLEEAAKHFREALALHPDDPKLQRNLRGALQQQLPAWHWPMLADEDRNAAYRAAIERAVDPGSVVLDIGTGSGLLAMMAARAGARQVIGCEISPALADAAREVVRCNKLDQRVSIINRKSTALRIGEDLAQRATVLVSEIVDVGLLGEGVLPSIRHAIEHLACPEVRVIPAGATVYAQLVEIPGLRRVNPVNQLAGFDLSAFDRFRIPDDYLEVRLKNTPHRFLSQPIEITRFNFTAPPPYISEQAPCIIDCDLRATASGPVHAVAFWFDLHLDETITVSTGPENGLDAWGQAVQFLGTDLEVTRGESMRLTALVSDTRIEYRLVPGPVETGTAGSVESANGNRHRP